MAHLDMMAGFMDAGAIGLQGMGGMNLGANLLPMQFGAQQLPHPIQFGVMAHTGLHIDRIPIDTLTSDVQKCLEANLGTKVLHIEDKRGQKTVHCCAFAVVQGTVDFRGLQELAFDLGVVHGVRSVPGTLEDTAQGVRQIRVQKATRQPESPPVVRPRCTLHIRVMTQRRHWAFGVRGMTWAGLTTLLEMAFPNLTEKMLLVADDTSQKTSQAHPENFICGFFVEMASVDAARLLLENCGDRRVVIDRVPFRVSAEYTRKESLKLYDKPPTLRDVKMCEFADVRAASMVICQQLRQLGNELTVDFPVKGDCFCTSATLGSQVPKTDDPSAMMLGLFKFMDADDVKRLPKWYVQRLSELGWQPPGTVRATDDILKGFLASIRMEEYYNALSEEGATTFLDLQMLDDALLLDIGMDKVLHRRKLLQQIQKLKERVIEPQTLPSYNRTVAPVSKEASKPQQAQQNQPQQPQQQQQQQQAMMEMQQPQQPVVHEVVEAVMIHPARPTPAAAVPQQPLQPAATIEESAPAAPAAPAAAARDVPAASAEEPPTPDAVEEASAPKKMHNPAKMHRGGNTRQTMQTLYDDDNLDVDEGAKARWTLPNVTAYDDSLLDTLGDAPASGATAEDAEPPAKK